MHRIFLEISSVDTWYAVMREARTWFGKEWASQGHVKRKLERLKYMPNAEPLNIWFDVPDAKFGTWVAVKLAVRTADPPNK